MAISDTVKVPTDTLNDTVNVQNDTVLSLIKKNNLIKAILIGEQLNISLSTVRRKIKNLKEKGMLERVRSDKTGYWRIID